MKSKQSVRAGALAGSLYAASILAQAEGVAQRIRLSSMATFFRGAQNLFRRDLGYRMLECGFKAETVDRVLGLGMREEMIWLPK